jgi:hypothetical protein
VASHGHALDVHRQRQQELLLGTGLSGGVRGSDGHIRLLAFGGFKLYDVPAGFSPAEIRSKQEGADGIIGNDALRRFNLIFDYSRGLRYLRPSTAFAAPFGKPE